jgi:uncharacterized protein YhbP (UPF0306 family)
MPLNHQVVNELLALSTMTLATSGPNGTPYAAPLYFVADEKLQLFFFSSPSSQHGHNLSQMPKAAASIYPECQDWRDIHGLQLRGEAARVPAGTAWVHGWGVYLAKFPFVAPLKDIVAQNRLYVFRPAWLRLVDNRQGFGNKEEWDLQ